MTEEEVKINKRKLNGTAVKGMQGFPMKDGTPAQKRVVGPDLEARILDVQRCITKGLTSVEIVKYAKEKWGIEQSSARNYIAKARERFADIPEEEWKAARGIIIDQCKDLYQKADNKEDYRTCLEILKYIGKMFKLDGEEEKQQTIIINLEGGSVDEYD